MRQKWPGEPWFRESLEKVERLRTLESADRTLGQLALRLVLKHPAVSVAIPGAKTREQAQANALASSRPLLSDEEMRLIDEIAPAP